MRVSKYIQKVTFCNRVKMGVIRIENKLHKRLQEWLDKNGNKYKFPSITAFVNNAIYEKLKQLESESEEKNEK